MMQFHDLDLLCESEWLTKLKIAVIIAGKVRLIMFGTTVSLISGTSTVQVVSTRYMTRRSSCLYTSDYRNSTASGAQWPLDIQNYTTDMSRYC